MTVSRVGIIGDGIVGLACALVAADQGVPVTLYAPALSGAASPASAGMLAPSVERTDGDAQTFGDDSRSAWPRLAARLRANGIEPPEVRQNGILHLALSEGDIARLQGRLRGDDRWLNAEQVRAHEPQLSPAVLGAAHFPHDGVVDAPAAIAALRRAVSAHARIDLFRSPVVAVECGAAEIGVRSADGVTRRFEHVVLATGAWSASLRGLPRLLPIKPLRGALVAVDGALVREPIYGPDGHTYVLPRGQRTIIGATSDWVGFEYTAGSADSERLLAAAEVLLPGVRAAGVLAPWAGLRPMTPDGRPILGPDPSIPSLIYACGHGRNGFLHAALTAEVVADEVLGQATRDLTAFSVGRFED
jgi:glycine oxidase